MALGAASRRIVALATQRILSKKASLADLGANRSMKLNVLAISLLLLLHGPAMAAEPQKLDLANVTCKQFTMLPKETIWTVTVWLDGYYTDEEDPTVVDIDKLKVKAEQLVSFCTENPKASLLAAAEAVLVR
jgi:HdeA/HdeB family protein